MDRSEEAYRLAPLANVSRDVVRIGRYNFIKLSASNQPVAF